MEKIMLIIQGIPAFIHEQCDAQRDADIINKNIPHMKRIDKDKPEKAKIKNKRT
jgi:hypothetical protein